jgi:hypothetical protein
MIDCAAVRLHLRALREERVTAQRIEFRDGVQTDRAIADPAFVKSELALDNYANQNYIACTLGPPEGRVAIVTIRWARDAMDVAGVRHVRMPGETFAAYGEVVWSWRRDPGVKPRRSRPAWRR